MERYEVIVLGLGAAGSATLYQLARRGVRALGIDRFSPPHTLGSSHGDTRITRLAIGEGAHYTPLAVRSHEIWRELEAATGRSLLTSNGGLIVSGATDGSGFHGTSFFATTVEAARKHNIAHEILDEAAIRRRFPQFAIGEGQSGYFEHSAGFVRPEECIAAQLTMSESLGAKILRDERVGGFSQEGGGVVVTTDKNRHAADKLVVAAGSWLPELLPAKFARHFKVFRQTLYWFDVADNFSDFAPGKFPVFIWALPRAKGVIYGFPAIGGPKDGFKVASESYETTTTPQTVRREVGSDEIARTYRDYIAPYFPGAGARCARTAVCLYTVTNDFGFVVDRHPDFENVIVASPCSGHGFKHSAALGEAISDLTQGLPSRFDLSAFGFDRFAP